MTTETPTPTTDLRPCGECYACCKFLGINELKKWPNESCKNLDGSLGACSRCKIYNSRPRACVTYSCGWRSGFGPDNFRPDKSGLMITFYAREDIDNSENRALEIARSGTPEAVAELLAATIIITDRAKAGTLKVGNLMLTVDALIREGFQDIKIVNYETKSVIHFFNGNIRSGKLAPRKKGEFEALVFFSFDPPIGTFKRERTDA